MNWWYKQKIMKAVGGAGKMVIRSEHYLLSKF